MKQVLAGVKSWAAFQKIAATLGPQGKGDLFELLTKHFLLLNPTYNTTLSDVWLLDEVPDKLRATLRLPLCDQGIDLIAKTKTGGFWAIQCKYRTGKHRSLSWREISTFVGLAFGVCKGIEFGLIAHVGERYTKVLEEAERVGFLSNDVWSTLEESFFDELGERLRGKPQKLVALMPRPHQKRAIQKAKFFFSKSTNTRGKIIMPCGTGKSLIGFWIADELEATTVVVAVPALWLIQQTLPVWLREFTARGHADDLRWLCVCSDETVEKDIDSTITHTQDLGYPPTTKVEGIVGWLDATKTAKKRVIFATYQSSKVLAEALHRSGTEVDLGIMDEAHKMVGNKERLFSHLLFDKNVLMKRRVFMTATERQFRGESDKIASMEDPAIYGDTIECLSFKEALEQNPPILSDYKIVTMMISRRDIENLVAENRYVLPKGPRWDAEVEAQMLASLIALRKSMLKRKIKHAVSFHRSIERAKTFRSFNDLYTETVADSAELETFHVTGATASSARKRITTNFANANRSLITNARCLTEGVDIPNIDCVLFADPKRSTVDIVQAVGRALRPAKDKRCGYVLVPVFSRPTEGEAFVETEAFAQVLKILRALATNDERIIEWFRAKNAGRKPSGKIVEIDIDERIAESIDLVDFADEIETKVWSRLAPLSWRTYDEAVKWVHKLKLKNAAEWRAYRRGGRKDLPSKPHDIPGDPQDTYGEEFRQKGGWGAWLGTGAISTHIRTSRPYDKSIKFVQNLGLKSGTEWAAYCSGERKDLPPKPHDIPAYPDQTYGEEFPKKGGWGTWLGTGTVATHLRKYRPYDEAVQFVHKLKLKSFAEWRPYCRGERKDLPPKPNDIPQKPSRTYGEEFRMKGGWGAWLGTYTIATKHRKYRSYDDAVKFVHTLKLKNRDPDWLAYVRGERNDLPSKPDDIPSNPNVVYDEFQEQGGWGAWLGTGAVANQKRIFSTYDEGVKFVHPLKLNNQREWQAYSRGKRKDLPPRPHNIPTNPYDHYGEEFRERGGWDAWLGSGNVARRGPNRKVLPLPEA